VTKVTSTCINEYWCMNIQHDVNWLRLSCKEEFSEYA